MKMWQGRFKKEADSSVNDFNSSISFDSRMYREDLQGSMAHAEMLGKCGIIEKSEADAIIAELKNILSDIENGKLMFSSDAEDIHMFVEQVLTERIGDTGKRLHTARSRNDQVALDIRMYIKNRIADISGSVVNLLEIIYNKACENTDTVMPGYTHLQRAQPITFAHHLCAYAFMFMRDMERIWQTYDRCNVMPLGSGAIAGTTYPIDREFVAKKLGFDGVTLNSIDGVSDRDFVLELSGNLTLLMMHLSRFSEEMILWCSSEFAFVELDDAFSTGSSIMPQKKNPDIAELVRGKTGRIYGNNTTLLTMMKSLPLAYNKDMQEDKEAIFDSIDNVLMCVDMFAKMLDTAQVRKDNMRRAAGKGFINATDCADYLVKKGLPFRTAYKIVGQLVAYCIDNDKTLETLTLDEYNIASDVFAQDVYDAINLENCVSGRDIIGGPGKTSTENQLSSIKASIDKYKQNI
ncbi:MAG: argininosuccinate lyase [Ruminococcaceae bacterium]|nr:argininosuccinate lyase [Oscillospiraceae bacterium]